MSLLQTLFALISRGEYKYKYLLVFLRIEQLRKLAVLGTGVLADPKTLHSYFLEPLLFNYKILCSGAI